MVFKPINLARQSFIKTFTHGYAQSLVASAQSSSYPTPSFNSLGSNFFGSFGKGTYHPAHYVSHTSSSSAGADAGAGPGGKQIGSDPTGQDGGLAAYYAAWHKHQRAEEQEWHQFQFAKRIGWKAPTTIPDVQPRLQPTKPVEIEQRPSRVLQRAKSANAVDDHNRTQSTSAVEARALAQIDEAITKEIENIDQPGSSAQASAHVQDVSQDVVIAATDSLTSTSSPSITTSQGYTTEATSVSDVESYTEHMVQLAESRRYAEIPPVFEAMLLTGTQPSSSAYNALLLAAINLPRGKHQVVPRVLDVYADMLRRRVVPDTATYAILIEMLAARTLDVSIMKKEMSDKQARYGSLEQEGNFMFRSDEAESKILAEDDSLTLAVRLFDTSVAVTTSHQFPSETYRLLITACAEQGRIGDMVRIYADMESQSITPPTSIFAPMIRAFARAGDLRSSVECYDEYKSLAIAHDQGGRSIVRKDEEIYAAVVQAYSLCGQPRGGLKFFGKVEDALEGSESLPALRDIVSLHALHPHWLAQGNHLEAINHAGENLTPSARVQALTAICIDAADKDLLDAANKAFTAIAVDSNGDASVPAMAMLAMHIRNADVGAAQQAWAVLMNSQPSVAFVESITMYALFNLAVEKGSLQEVGEMFARIRRSEFAKHQDKSETVDRIDEAIDTISRKMLMQAITPPAWQSVMLLRMMIENGGLVTSVAEHFLAGFGPDDVARMPWIDIDILLQAQAGLLIDARQLDVAHEARFTHMVDLLVDNRVMVDNATGSLISQALLKINRPDLLANWQLQQYPAATTLPATLQYNTPYSPISTRGSFISEDTFDPYAASTDFKGSSLMAEDLENTHRQASINLDSAWRRMIDMRRNGQHPRYTTYAKFISTAGTENNLDLASQTLSMAKQDIPFLSASRLVSHGWTLILDAMVSACLNAGNRSLAAQYHQELRDMGSAPSANTYGLFITTMKDSSKISDEATAAVKIFNCAIAEGVEPTAFLYNALLGKLGKARRTDDCIRYLSEMRTKGIRATSVTYGTIVNACCRVSDTQMAEKLFDEMEGMQNYRPRAAPYNSIMQYFLETKRDRAKVLSYYSRMQAHKIAPTQHTYKLLIQTHATLEPINLSAAEEILTTMRASGAEPEAVHYAALIHAKGCALHDLAAARSAFDSVLSAGRIRPHESIYQAMFESLAANNSMASADALLQHMQRHRVHMTPYIANTLIKGWTASGEIKKAEELFAALGREKREPSTYEAMVRAYLVAERVGDAKRVVGEALARGYPPAVAGKICDLVGGGGAGVKSMY